MNKRALSPVIATVLLISLGLSLAAIIIFWGKSFIPEEIYKDGPIKDKCKEVSFEATYNSGTHSVSIVNEGNIPIGGIKIGKKTDFSLNYIDQKFIDIENPTRTQQKRNFAIENPNDYPISGEQIFVVPILVGKTSSNVLKSFDCDAEFGQIATQS